VKLDQGRISLGRDLSCDIIFTDVSVSRHHAELIVSGQRVHIRDLNSRNGTFLNKERILEVDAGVGDQVAFASVEFVLVSSAEDELETEDPRAGDRPEHSARSTIADLLTAAEDRVFERLLQGLSEKAIACELGVSRHTVHRHVCRIYKLSNVNSRSELLALFVVRPNSQTRPL
jgi:pSer/pThr/pTyr-binding forkhead associated (FHA) protein